MPAFPLIRTILSACAILWLGIIPVSAEHYLVYLIGGQSNAGGRGDASKLTEPLAAPQKDVRFYWHRSQKSENGGHVLEDQWTDLAPGSGHGVTKPVYPKEFGPEVSFGRALADAHPKEKIALIKYTHGGTSLSANWSEKGPMYKTFVATTQAALGALKAAGHTCELRGMIWQQGENDAAGPAAAAYQANLTNLIARIRKDLFENKPLPFVIGGLSDSQNPEIKTPGTGWNLVRKAQETVAQTVPKAGFANSDGFSTRTGEAIHFSHEGQIALGKAHAAEMLRLEKP
ncbi:MAG: hypothetical protein CFE26_18670 [Verrucomicrobiales bacterium VVV1]|nr:MAG: hypothetical protein CFE26_18670 [Verrucomicrobiales bacterium VVV1]